VRDGHQQSPEEIGIALHVLAGVEDQAVSGGQVFGVDEERETEGKKRRPCVCAGRQEVLIGFIRGALLAIFRQPQNVQA